MNTITVEELKARLDSGEKINLLDVRELHEREDFNIGGKHVPVGKIQLFETEDFDEWKEKEIVLYCRSGNRSGIAANILLQLGFANPVNLVGGMLDWREKFGDEK